MPSPSQQIVDFLSHLQVKLSHGKQRIGDAFLRSGALYFHAWGIAHPFEALHFLEDVASRDIDESGLCVLCPSLAYLGACEALKLREPWSFTYESDVEFDDEGDFNDYLSGIVNFNQNVAAQSIASFGSLSPKAIGLLGLFTDSLQDDWSDQTGNFEEGEQFNHAALDFEGQLHGRIEDYSNYYDTGCSKNDADILANAASNWTLADALRREIADPGISKEAHRL